MAEQEITRFCGRCKIWHPISFFFKNNRRPDGLCLLCKRCNSLASGKSWIGPKTCPKCQRQFRSNCQSDICQQCREVCHCGKPKDHRANECISCGMSRKALVQWATPEKRAKITAAIRINGISSRMRYADLHINSCWNPRPHDQRMGIHYWDENERKRHIYRYQWVWEHANGPIPDGLVVHHINHDCTDDRLENLKLMTNIGHMRYHGSLIPSAPLPEWTCLCCGIRFKMRPRGGRIGVRKYCSRACKQRHMGILRIGKLKPGSRRWIARESGRPYPSRCLAGSTSNHPQTIQASQET